MAVRLSDLLINTLGELRYQPTLKPVRVMAGGEVVADTTRAVVVWEPRRVVPSYAVPVEDLAAELMPAPPRTEEVPSRLAQVGGMKIYTPDTPFAFHTCPGTQLTVGRGAQRWVGAAYAPDDPALAGYVILDFAAFDWFEGDEALLAHPRDPFSRIDVRASSRRVRLEHRGHVVAESVRTLALYEGVILPPRYYLPMSDVQIELRPSPTRTSCAYKGQASYWSGLVGGEVLEDIAWSYPEPLPDMSLIKGRVALFNERLDVFIDDVRQQAVVTPWSRKD